MDIPAPILSQDATTHYRVTGDVDRHELWFESATPLRPSPEAFGCAFLLPAMSMGENLDLAAHTCARWLRNVDEARAIAGRWWGYRGGHVAARPVDRPAASRGVAMFFTGGVDSFYTLLHPPERIDAIVFIEGFDVPLDDEPRLAKIRSWLQSVASGKGVELIVVRTNLRVHPTFRRISWNITHGAALAAAGHCLSERFSRFYIASTELKAPPWGSHPELDATWSSSAASFINHAPQVSRLDKVRAIAGEPLVSRHLRVCWQLHASDLNCGVCEKCVRTQLELQAVAPGFFRTQQSFPRRSLLRCVNALDTVHQDHHKQWQDAIAELESRRLRAAANRLIQDRGVWRHTRRRLRALQHNLGKHIKPKEK